VPAWLIVGAIVVLAGTVCLAQATNKPLTPEIQQPKMSLFELLLMGRWFMIPIGLCSLIGLAIIIERLIALRRKMIIRPGFLAGLKSVFRHTKDDRATGMEYCRTHDCPIARVVAAGIGKFHKGDKAVEDAIEDAGAGEVTKLRRNLRMLYAVAAVAPMLGLLGTVWGMIEAFQIASAKGLGRPELLATGIYKALVTTFAGLTVAIPALIFYYYFLGKIDQLVSEMNDVSIEFVEHYMAEEGPPAKAPPRAAARAAAK